MPNRLFVEAYPPQTISPVAYLGFIASAPFLQWYLLTTPMSSFLASGIPLSIGLLTPLLFTTEIWFFFGFGCAWQLINACRLLDVAFVDRKVSSRWSFRDYTEYFFALETTSINKADKKHLEDDNGKAKKRIAQGVVLPHERNAQYYKSVVLRVAYQYIIYHFVCWYLDANPPNRQPVIRGFTPLTFKAQAEQLMLTLSVYYMLNIIYMVLYHIIAEVLQIPYRPMMNSPFIATSFREFWSNRWNLIVKESLHRASFKPVIALLTPKPKMSNSKGDSKPARAPLYVFIIGAMSSFLLSGLVHEWMILTITDTPSYGEHMMFFVYHGLLTFSETFLAGMSKKYLGSSPWEKYPLLMAPLTWFLMSFITPFFMNPLVRDEILIRARMPILPCPFPLK